MKECVVAQLRENLARRKRSGGMTLLPANIDLAGAEAMLLMRAGREYALKRALAKLSDRFDVVIIDCPPQLGFTTMTALLASTGLLITVVPSMLDVASMAQFLEMAGETVQALEEATGPIDWAFLKYLVARYEPTDVPQSQMAGFLRSILLDQVLNTPMLKSTAISDAGMTQQTIYELDPSQVVKKTLSRIIESVNGVADEFERTIQQAWGREVD